MKTISKRNPKATPATTKVKFSFDMLGTSFRLLTTESTKFSNGVAGAMTFSGVTRIFHKFQIVANNDRLTFGIPRCSKTNERLHVILLHIVCVEFARSQENYFRYTRSDRFEAACCQLALCSPINSCNIHSSFKLSTNRFPSSRQSITVDALTVVKLNEPITSSRS